ncbi:MAG: serine hydrolase [Gemmatimonadaceae bacterium]|nr:serine hydrolase [Gemmatimonadaceae bacterium]
MHREPTEARGLSAAGFLVWIAQEHGMHRTLRGIGRQTLMTGALLAACVVGTPAPAAAQRPVSFTTTEGTWISLDVAPDGRTIAFELLGDVYLLPIAGGTASPILTGTAFQSQPRYSPDGTRLAFISDSTGSDNVWIAAADGSGARAVSRLPRAVMMSTAWAADGSAIYVTVLDGRSSADLWRVDVATGTSTKVIANANGPAAPLVSSPAPGVYSAHPTVDGRFIYFSSVTPRPYGSRLAASSTVMRRNLTTGRDEPVVLDEPAAMSPVLSRDGRWLVYAAQSRGRTGLRLRDMHSSAERWLAWPTQRNELESRASRDVMPGYAITPDTRAVVVAFGGKMHRIALATGADDVIPFTATYATSIAPAPTSAWRATSDSVRGRIVQQLAMAGDGRLAFSMFASLYVAAARGGVPRRVTVTEDAREFMPAWSPDGKYLAFVTWGADGGHVWKVRSTGGAPVRLSDTPAYWIDPVWSPDGRAVYALKAAVGTARTQPMPLPTNAELVRLPADGGPATTLAPAAGMRHPHFTRDTTRIWFSSPAGLGSVDRRGGDRRLHARAPVGTGPGGAPLTADVRLSPDGRQVAMLAGDRVWLQPLPSAPGTEPVPLDIRSAIDSSGPASTGMAWMPDGSRLAWMTGATMHLRATGTDSTISRSLSVTRPRARPRGSIVLRGARVITMRGNEVLENADIVVTDDHIASIGARGASALPTGVRVIDVTGKTIMPGIIDVHAHWALRRELLEPEAPSTYANLAYGVTTIRDPQASAEIFAYADLIEASGLPSPRIYSTGPGLFAETNFLSLDDARWTLRAYRDEYRTHLIKSYLVGNRQQRQWVARASRDLGLLTTTEGGADTKLDLTHAIDGFHGNEHALPNAPLHDDVVQLMARSGIHYTPTLLVSFGAALPVYRLLAQERPFDDPRLNRFFPRGELYQRTATRLLAFPAEDYNDRETSASANSILQAGGHVALGGHGEMQGLQVHWEMRLLAAGGMSAHDVLRVATINSAAAIGLDRDLGSIDVGKLADLLVLDRDPLADIRNTTSLRYVMQNGVLYNSETLDRVAPTVAALPTPWWRADEPVAVAAASFDRSAVDQVALAEMRRQQSPGLGVAVIKGDRVLMSKGYGMANLEQQIPVTDETMFESGSVGKMFTAAGIMALVEDHRIALDSSIRRYLPEAPASWQGITVRHLLSHTSGIPDYTGDAMDYRRDYTEAQLTTMAFALPLEFSPGTRWNYSNTGYVMLGVIMSRITGAPYWQYLRSRIFTPSGMTTARIISESEIVPHRASGYLPTATGFVHQNWVSPTLNTTADGSLLISVRDFVAWSAVVRERRVLTKESWAALFTPITLMSGRTHPYGFGWFLDSLNGQRVVQHGGSWQGFRNQFTRFEGSDLTVVVLANSGAFFPDVAASRIAAAVDSTLSPPPAPTVVIADRDPATTAMLGAVLGKTARGELALGDFEFVRATVVPRMSAAYARLLQPLGALTRLELLSTGVLADDRTFVYRAIYPDAVVLVNARVGPRGGLTGLSLTRQ